MEAQDLIAALSALIEAQDTPAESPAPAKKKRSTRTAARKPASATASAARRGTRGNVADYVPTAERRAGMPTGRMLWALNAAGLLTVRKTKGSPLTFGACWDARAGIES